MLIIYNLTRSSIPYNSGLYRMIQGAATPGVGGTQISIVLSCQDMQALGPERRFSPPRRQAHEAHRLLVHDHYSTDS